MINNSTVVIGFYQVFSVYIKAQRG
jgi:hypothetical protein